MRAVLLDSHVVVWWLGGTSELGPTTRDLIRTADRVVVSVITPWELGIKRALGKLRMPDNLVDQLEAEGFELLPITSRHAELAPALPAHHGDPFDRMLVAQAMLEMLTLVTADAALTAYDVTVHDARD